MELQKYYIGIYEIKNIQSSFVSEYELINNVYYQTCEQIPISFMYEASSFLDEINYVNRYPLVSWGYGNQSSGSLLFVMEGGSGNTSVLKWFFYNPFIQIWVEDDIKSDYYLDIRANSLFSNATNSQ